MAPRKRYGTFLGVFTPTILTILGVIMYLRMGWVVGHGGLYGALAIVVFSNAITLITALSMSSLATNMRVGVGGAYYMISRSLGLALGGSIGIPLYLSQTLSVTLYAFGLAETIRLFWDEPPPLVLAAVAALLVVAVTGVAAKSTELTLKLQLPILVIIALSLVSLFAGADWGAPIVVVTDRSDMWPVFAVFFPAVTGILAGVSLSGDLENPGKAIPRGALAAVAVGFVVYLLVPIALAKSASLDVLVDKDQLEWMAIAAFPPVVILGMWGAILSSAFGSILGAPRTLQALAEDRVVPSIFGQTDRATGEPVLGLRVTGVIAFCGVLLGDLNAVASWVTVFFLTTYGALNAVAALEDLVGDPSFRPRIRIPWWVSGLGAVGCFVAMAAIDPLACVVAVCVELGLFFVLSRRSLQTTWGDVRTGLWLSMARYSLMQLRTARLDPRNWRPHVLVFTADMARNIEMVRLASEFSQHRGVVTTTTLMVGDVEEHTTRQQLLEQNGALLADNGIVAFCEVAAVGDLDAGVVTCAQAHGVGRLVSNTVMLGWPGPEPERMARLLALVRKLVGLEKCTLIYCAPDAALAAPSVAPLIVIWWKGLEYNGDLMLLLAHLVSQTFRWKGARLVLKSVVSDVDTAQRRQGEFEAMLAEIRIPAQVDVVVRDPESESVIEVIRRHSRQADLVFLGMSVAAPGGELAYARELLRMLDQLPTTILVRNAGPFRGMLV